MDEIRSNVISLVPHAQPAPEPLEAPPIYIPLDSIDSAREAITKAHIAFQLGYGVLNKAPEYGEARALDGLKQLLDGLCNLLDSDRAAAIEPIGDAPA